MCNNNNNLSNKILKNSNLFQYGVAFSVTLLMMSASTVIGWPSPTMPNLLSPDSPIQQITFDESGWIVVSMIIGSIWSPIPAAWLMNTVGRKLTLLFGAVPMILGWLLIAFANSIIWIYCARALHGITFGMVYTIIPMYLGEIASDDCRGSVMILMNVMDKIGFIYVFSIGSYVPMHTMAWILLLPLLIFLITFSCMPESPYYLIGNSLKDDGHADDYIDEKALNSLARLRSNCGNNNNQQNTESIIVEYQQIKTIIQNEKLSNNEKINYFTLFTQGNRKSLFILFGLVGTNLLSGGIVILSYAGIIFGQVNNSFLIPSQSMFLLGLVQLIAAIILYLIIDCIRRRILLITSGIFCGLANSMVFIYFLLTERFLWVGSNVEVNSIGTLAIFAVLLFMISYTMGLGGVSIMIVGEIFPKNLRAHAGAIFAITAGILNFIISKLFQVIASNLGDDISFLIFALCSFLSVPFYYFIVPETKGKSLDEIQNILKN